MPMRMEGESFTACSCSRKPATNLVQAQGCQTEGVCALRAAQVRQLLIMMQFMLCSPFVFCTVLMVAR